MEDRKTDDNNSVESRNFSDNSGARGYVYLEPEASTGKEFDLLTIWQHLVKNKFLITTVVVVSTAVFIGATFLMTPIYRSQVLLAPAANFESSSGLSGLAGQFGGLAALAGIDVQNTGGDVKEAMAVLQSREFLIKFIEKEDLFPVIFQDKWDPQRREWLVDDPDEAPTDGDAYRAFEERILSVSEDQKTGFVTVGIEWRDRDLAAQWANRIIDDLNQYLRQSAINEAERSIAFLQAELDRTSVVGIQQGIFRLIESQVQSAMLANVREEFAFKVLDPAVVSDEDNYVWPNRRVIGALGALFGFGLALLFVLLRSGARHDSK